MRTRLTLLALATALTLTACGGGSGSTDTTTAEATAEATATAAAAQWDTAIDVAEGVTVKVSSPASFTPGGFASNYLPGQVANIFNIEVTNGGSKAFDMSTIAFAPASGDAFCSDVLDGDNGINGAPTDPVAAGSSVDFKYGIACTAKVGDPLTLGVTVGTTSVTLSGKLV